MRIQVLFPHLPFLLLFLLLGGVQAQYDVLVYDASSGGVTAAVSAARAGLKTALLCASYPSCFAEGGKRIGGLSSGGLGQTDIGSTFPYIGGLALEFYQKNRAHYSLPETPGTNCRLPDLKCNVTYNLEPHVARQIFQDMLEQSHVDIYYEANAIAVHKSTTTGKINTLTTNTRTYSAAIFIDASYEGDLMSLANVSYRVGRESRSTYNESLAGHSATASSNQFTIEVDPFDQRGTPLPFTTLPNASTHVGAADDRVQSYNFRLCVTKETNNVAPFPKPKNYNSSVFELLRRYLVACSSSSSTGASSKSSCQLGFPSCLTSPVPKKKYDMNNCGPFSSDFIGGSLLYPEATFDLRKKIWHQHLEYQQGVLYYVSNDPAVPMQYRDLMKPWGLCKDEFVDNTLAPHWPPALYVRAARRLVGDRVFTQNTPHAQRDKGGIANVSISIGGYNFDSHNAERLACANVSVCGGQRPKKTGTSSYTWNEGDVETAPGLYQIPVWVMFPSKSEATNLLVVAAPSASHIGMSTLRMEPQFMMVGHAAGTVAALAIRSHVDFVQDVDVDRMRVLLVEQGMILEF